LNVQSPGNMSYADGVALRDYTIEWSYGPTGLVQSVVEQPRTTEEKATYYSYTRGDKYVDYQTGPSISTSTNLKSSTPLSLMQIRIRQPIDIPRKKDFSMSIEKIQKES
jgi:hypothetical protein